MLQSNQSKFYYVLDEENHEENVILDRVKTREFWHGIWEKDVKQKIGFKMQKRRGKAINNKILKNIVH